MVLPPEVLSEVMDSLDLREAALCAMVCRAWLPLARAVLYRQVKIHYREPQHALKLSYTLGVCEEARQSVRHLIINAHKDSDKLLLPHLQWLHGMQDGQLETLEVIPSHPNLLLPLLQFLLLQSPACNALLHTVLFSKFLEVDNSAQASNIGDRLSFIKLRSMGLWLTQTHQSYVWPRLSLPQLRSLHLSISGFIPSIPVILGDVSSTLEDLTIQRYNTTHNIALSTAEQLTLSNSISKLTRLSFLSLKLHLSESSTVLDDALPHLLNLNFLESEQGIICASSFARLPPCVQTVIIRRNSNSNFVPDERLLQHAGILAVRKRAGQNELKLFQHMLRSDPGVEEQFYEDCERAGIRYSGPLSLRKRSEGTPQVIAS